MKKIAIALGVLFSSWMVAQYYPNYGWNNGSYEEMSMYDEFPDEYYYEYPSDYYDEGYYRSAYNDYRSSISMVNWNAFFRQNRLADTQIRLIIELNQRFPSYSVWSSQYRMNPKRWWYDRFYALERILGPQVFIVFQNNYYHGYSPVRYYNEYWRENYYPRYSVVPKYRRVNVDNYRVNRYDYHRNYQNAYNWNYRAEVPSHRDERAMPRTGGFRNLPDVSHSSSVRNGGFRSDSHSSGQSNIRSGGLRQDTYSTPRSGNVNSNGGRTGGFR